MNHAEAEDSLHYLTAITYEGFSSQFHPNHLLYNPINYLFYHGWKLFGYQGAAELPAAILNIVAALATLALVYRIVRSWGEHGRSAFFVWV